MTNTIYFHSTIRDDVSTTTEEEETPPTSNRYAHQQGSSSVNPNDDEGGILEYSNLKEFSFKELERAAGHFRKNHVLEEGTFGSVYIRLDEFERFDYARRYSNSEYIGGGSYGRVFKGWIDENKLTATKPGKGIPVAIKQLAKVFHHSFMPEIHGKFQAEVNYMGRLYHPNLVRLIGYCLQKMERLLVYEFMLRGSLENHLFEKVSTPLSWSVRMKIALGAAKGLAFLHNAPINVIHRDCKSSNILLDKDYNAKLGNFGLAIDGPTGDETHVDTAVMGTWGYIAQEYMATGHLTAKCDVYSFGVVLLEMLCGRRVMDYNRPSGEHTLVDWAKPYLNDKHKVYRVADRQLEGQYSLEGFQKAANLALICLSIEGMSRPNMDEVVKVLGEL